MHLSSNLWYVRWFFWSCRAYDRFRRLPSKREFYNSSELYQRGTNLCQFFRMLLFGSLITVITLAVYGYLFYTVIILPFILFPSRDIGHGVLIVAAIVAAVALILSMFAGIAIGINRYANYRKSLPKKPARPPGFATLVWAYAVAVKHQFCPTITFEKNPHDA